MEPHVPLPPGDLILLTGPSGVGKSAIAQRLHQRLDGDDWVVWLADLCQPTTKSVSPSIAPDEAEQRERRMFVSNLASIAAYLVNGWSVVVELAVMTPVEAASVRGIALGRLMVVQLDCSPSTLAAHLSERSTPVADDWAVKCYETWRSVDLGQSVRIEVDDRTPDQVVDELLSHWKRITANAYRSL